VANLQGGTHAALDWVFEYGQITTDHRRAALYAGLPKAPIIRMRSLIVFLVACTFPAIAQTGRTANDQSQSSASVPSDNQQPAKPIPFPLQLEVRAPFGPAVFLSEARMHLLYELHLTNFAKLYII